MPNGPDLQPVYISEVWPNPEGEDGTALNDEVVLLEMNAETTMDLSGFMLVYGQRKKFTFRNAVSSVRSGESVEIHSGSGSDHKDTTSHPEDPDYILYVGSDKPLLDNDGMRLTLKNSEGNVIDTVRYPKLGPGAVWARPE